MSKKMFMMLLLALIVPAAYAYSAGEFLDDFRSIFTGFTVGSEVQDSSDSKSAPVDSTKNSSDVSTPQKTIPSTSQKTSIGGVSCRESWACTPWSECTNSQRTRKCTDTNQCGTSSSKPSEAEPCIVQGCQDGTPTGQCSSEKPLYCSGGNLIPNCEICGCSLNYICEESLCIENVDGEETTDPEILNLPPVIQEIEDMNVLLGEPFSVYISATDIDDDSLTYYFQNQDNFYSTDYLDCSIAQGAVSCSTKKSGDTHLVISVSDGIDETSASFGISIINQIPEEGDVVGGIYNTEPIANAGSDITSPPNQGIILDASLSYDAENNIGPDSYRWDEGGTLIASEKITRLELSEGDHSITLTVTDFEGESSEDTVNVKIIEKTTCSQTSTNYFPDDTICNKAWPSNEGVDIKINSQSKSCDTFEVCSESLDPVIEDAIKCSNDQLEESSKIEPCNYAKKYGANAKSIQALYIIKSMGRSAVYMKGYYDAEMCCKGVKELCPSQNYLYRAEPLPQDLKNRGLRCPNTPENNPPGEWLSSTNLQLNSVALSEVPTHASLNILKTGTCVDYSAAVTTLLRKLGYKEDEVYTVEASNHAYNLVRFPLERYYTIIDMTGNNEGIKPGKVPSGYDYCENIINCYNDNGRVTCPLNNEINGCIGKKQNPSRSVENVGSKVLLTFKDLWRKVLFEIKR